MSRAVSETDQKQTLIHTDPRGRATLGSLVGNKDYVMHIMDDGDIVLRPVRIIPERELWLWQNPEALGLVQAGLKDSAEGRLNDLGSFAEFVDLDTDD